MQRIPRVIERYLIGVAVYLESAFRNAIAVAAHGRPEIVCRVGFLTGECLIAEHHVCSLAPSIRRFDTDHPCPITCPPAT